MSDYCPECDQPLMWGGMAWVPHTDGHHAATRWRLVRYAARLLRERAAVLAGHRVTIRFTQTCAWFACSCGVRGPAQYGSDYARGDGHAHLATATASRPVHGEEADR